MSDQSTTNENVTFEGWCVVELMGHQQIAGRVSEAPMFGTSLMRVDVPATSKRAAFTKFYGGSAIYGITPVEEAVAKAMAEGFNEVPIQEWRMKVVEPPAPALPAPPTDVRTMHLVSTVECYTSSSGNKTWKAWDDEDYLIYLRQAHRDILTAADLWDALNEMQIGDLWNADFVVYTVPDGDFLKPVEFEPCGEVFAPRADIEDVDGGEAVVPDLDSTISEQAVDDVLREDLADETEGWREEEDLSPKAKAQQWARQLLEGEFVIFDTETTGVDSDAQIIQIGVIDQDGRVLLDQTIKPAVSIENTAYHGLTDEMVKDAPALSEVYHQIKAALEGKVVIAYNFEFDNRILRQDLARCELEPIKLAGSGCAMEEYAQYYGQWNARHGNYKWQSLENALFHFGLKHEDFGTRAHDACTDARATLALIKKMADREA